MNLAFKITGAATPLGSTLLTLTKEDLEAGSGFRVELAGLGAGRIVINRNRPECTAANFAQDNYVRVYDLDISTTIPLGGFFLDDTQIQVLSLDEEGGEIVQFGGPGALSYFGRCALWNINYVSFGDDAHFGPRIDGLWYWYNDQYGDILKRMIDEAQDADRPAEGHGIDDLTYDFGSTLDSAGDSWDSFTGNYTLPAGTNYLDIAQRLRDVGLTIQVSGDLLMQAYQNFYGVDRTTDVFATGKVRFVNVNGAAGANIVEELPRKSHPSLQLSRVLVKGDVGEPATMVTRDAASYNVAREGFAEYPSSHALATLQAVGDQALQIRSDSSDVPTFRHIPGFDSLSGLYAPFPADNGAGDNILLGLANSSLKSSGTDPTSSMSQACDGNLLLRWTPPNGQGPVPEHYWAADVGSAQEAVAFRYYLAPANIGDVATEAIIYGSNDAGAWSWLPSGKLVADPAANGWVEVGGWTGAGSGETGIQPLDAPGTYRYWLVRATAGGSGVNNEFDISEIWLYSPFDAGYTYWVGDLVTLHTGLETGDYDEVNLRVYAINWELDDDEWWPRPELGGLLQLASQTIQTSGVAGVPGSGSGGVVTVTSTPAPPMTVERELTNKSGGAVARGDVVVLDPDNDEAFETTAIAGETREIGIAQEDIASNVRGRVATHGYVEVVNCVASVTRGHFGFTSTTVKLASGASDRAAGAFCQFLKGGTEPSAILFGVPDEEVAETGSAINVSHLITATVFPIIAHRGDINPDDGYPENTIEALRQAATRGAHGVEFDLWRSSEGTWHLMHDESVVRTTDGTGNITAKTDAAIAALNIDGGIGYDAGRHGTSLNVPTLDAALAAIVGYDLILWFDLNESGTTPATELAQYIVDAGLVERAIILINGATQAPAIKAVNPHIQVACGSAVETTIEDNPDIDRFLGEEDEVTNAAFVIARNPKPVDAYKSTGDSPASETTFLTNMWERGVRSLFTYNLPESLLDRNEVVLDIITGSSLTPATTVEDETTWGITPAVGTDLEYARQDHTHGTPTEPSGGGIGEILISDTPSTPLIFADLIQNEAQDDLVYADP